MKDAYRDLQKFLKKQPNKAKQLEAVKQDGDSIRFILLGRNCGKIMTRSIIIGC